MAKKKGRKTPPPGASAARGAVLSAAVAQERGEGHEKHPLLWFSSFLLIITGYILLHKVDPGGQNAWAILSPVLILAGYLLVIPAIILTYRS